MAEPKVGPADPATRRAAIERHLAEGRREGVGSRQPRAESAKPANPPRPIRGGARRNVIDSMVDEVQEGQIKRR